MKTILFDRPIAFQRSFVTITGSINAALFLSQAVYWTNRTTDPDGWFYKTRDEWQDETGMTRREQEGARKVLCEKGLLEEKRVGVPAIIHYRVLVSALESSWHKTAQLVGTKPPIQLVQNRPSFNTETTTETTHISPLPPKGDTEVDAESLYAAYPRHVGKELAIKAITKAIKRIGPDRDAFWLLERVEHFAFLRRGEDPKFTPHPATWFNRGSYDDEELQPKPKPVWVDSKTGEPIQKTTVNFEDPLWS